MSNEDRTIIVTVDVALFCLHQDRLQMVVLRREREPFEGQLALPGGYVHKQEDRDSLAAAMRMLKEKTGIIPPYLEQLYSFADGARDPRGWSVSMSYFALVDKAVLDRALAAQPVHSRFELVDVDSVPRLSFDHNRIVDAAVQRLRNKSAYSTLPCYLLGEEFTFAELMRTYELVLGTELSKNTFRRKLEELDVLEETDNVRIGAHRPAQLFRLKPDVARRLKVLSQPL